MRYSLFLIPFQKHRYAPASCLCEGHEIPNSTPPQAQASTPATRATQGRRRRRSSATTRLASILARCAPVSARHRAFSPGGATPGSRGGEGRGRFVCARVGGCRSNPGTFFFATPTAEEKKYLKGLSPYLLFSGVSACHVSQSVQCALACRSHSALSPRRGTRSGSQDARVPSHEGEGPPAMRGGRPMPASAAGAPVPVQVRLGWLGGWLQRRRGAAGTRELGQLG